MPFDMGDEGSQPWHQGAHGNKNIVGSWTGGTRGFGRGRGEHDSISVQALGAGLPGEAPRSPILVKTGLRRVPAQLPQIAGKAKQSNFSSSMPDLHSGHDRPALVKASPIVSLTNSVSPGYEPVSPPQKIRKSPDRRNSAGDGHGDKASFEAPYLYVGLPPPNAQGGPHEASVRDSHGLHGASHTVPNALRKQFAMAANALELGSHVQRHAAVEQDLGEDFQSPLIVSHCVTPMPFQGDAPRGNAAPGKTLLS
jgi:hypothetical protein